MDVNMLTLAPKNTQPLLSVFDMGYLYQHYGHY